MTTVTQADRQAWAATRTLVDVGELTAQWLEGRISSVPGYHGGPDEETLPLVPTLARLNRAGFVTDVSQPAFDGPGCDGAHWKQRAAVEGFADAQATSRLTHAAEGAGLLAVVFSPTELPARRYCYDRAVAVTRTDGCDPACPTRHADGCDYTWFATQVPRRHIRDAHIGHGMCGREAVKALCEAWQVTLIDPEWGREALLWDVLDGALSVVTP